MIKVKPLPQSVCVLCVSVVAVEIESKEKKSPQGLSGHGSEGMLAGSNIFCKVHANSTISHSAVTCSGLLIVTH